MKNTLAAAVFLSIVPYTIAQWSLDPGMNNVICNYSGDQFINGIVNDGSGGAIISWWDKRVITGYQLPYAQRISSDGLDLWEDNGIPLYHSSLTAMEKFKIKSDENGGAFYSFMRKEEDPSFNYDLMGGHINSAGDTLTFKISSSQNLSEESSDICLSNNGSAIIAYEVYYPTLNNYDIYVQRVNKNGEVLWNKDSSPAGVALVSDSKYQRYPQIVSDGSGGAFIVWEDLRNQSATFWDIYIQRIDSNGTALWSSGGIPVVQMMNNQRFPRIAAASYGVVVCWDDERSGYTRLYARGMSFDGTVVWGGSEGKVISDSVLVSESADIISLGSSGNNTSVALCWSQNSFHQSLIDIYAQVLDSAGNPLWQDKGLLVCNADQMQWKSKIASVNENGASKIIVVWQDERNSATTNNDIYAQKISMDGAFDWQINGIEVSIANNYQSDPLIISGESGFSITAWTDGRNSFGGADIYAQRLSPGGIVSLNDKRSKHPDSFALFNNYPNPFNPATKIEFQVRKEGLVALTIYDPLGNEIEALLNNILPAGKYEIIFNGSSYPSGVYFYKLQSGEYAETKKMILVK